MKEEPSNDGVSMYELSSPSLATDSQLKPV